MVWSCKIIIINFQPSIIIFKVLIEESIKKIYDASCLWCVIHLCNNEVLRNLCEVRPFKFQWQNDKNSGKALGERGVLSQCTRFGCLVIVYIKIIDSITSNKEELPLLGFLFRLDSNYIEITYLCMSLKIIYQYW